MKITLSSREEQGIAIEQAKPPHPPPQLLWLEMALFSKKALHNIEKHS